MTIVRRDVELEVWPVLPSPETNKQRIIRALREADGVVEQCFHEYEIDEKRCALGTLGDTFGGNAEFFVTNINHEQLGLTSRAGDRIVDWNDEDKFTFAQIADRLEADDSYWNEKADEEFAP